MKYLNLLFFSFLVSIGNAQNGCILSDIIPIEHGMTKFKVIKTISTEINIIEDTKTNYVGGVYNRWEKPDYLYGDSVYFDNLHYDYISHPCLKGIQNDLHLLFVDDHLYKMIITLKFSNKEFEKCLKHFNFLTDLFKTIYPYSASFITTLDDTEEQIGEGVWLTPEEDEKINKGEKIEKISVGYKIQYESKYNSFDQKFYQSNNVDKYILTIMYVNLKGTKLTNEGY